MANAITAARTIPTPTNVPTTAPGFCKKPEVEFSWLAPGVIVAAPLAVLAVPEYVAITRADVSAAPVAPWAERVVAIRVGVDASKVVGAAKVNDAAVMAGGVTMLAWESTDAELAGRGA